MEGCHPDIIGLPGLRVTDIDETWERVTISAELAYLPTCGRCQTSDSVTWWEPWNSLVVADTPIRGRPTSIMFLQDRFRCRACKRDWVGRLESFLPERAITRRAFRYIEDRSFRFPRAHIAREIGIGPDRVDEIIDPLADRLSKHHRFPTPRVLGIDDLKMNGKTYIIFSDAEAGHAIGMTEKGDGSTVAKWLKERLADHHKVEIVTSDLHKLNTTIKADFFASAVHVADQWHVIRACQTALRRVLRHELNDLDGRAKKAEPDRSKRETTALGSQATMIRQQWRRLIGRRTARQQKEGLFPDREELRPVLDQHERISKAFYARLALTDMYQASDLETARGHLETFYRKATDSKIKKAMADAVKRVRGHEEMVLNYFRVLEPNGVGELIGHSSGSVERRNQYIRESWRAGRGVTEPRYLSMLALYQPWHLDTDIVECGAADCANIEGPVSLVPGLIAQPVDGPIMAPTSFRCRSCAASDAESALDRGRPLPPAPGPALPEPFIRERRRTPARALAAGLA